MTNNFSKYFHGNSNRIDQRLLDFSRDCMNKDKPWYKERVAKKLKQERSRKASENYKVKMLEEEKAGRLAENHVRVLSHE